MLSKRELHLKSSIYSPKYFCQKLFKYEPHFRFNNCPRPVCNSWFYNCTVNVYRGLQGVHRFSLRLTSLIHHYGAPHVLWNSWVTRFNMWLISSFFSKTQLRKRFYEKSGAKSNKPERMLQLCRSRRRHCAPRHACPESSYGFTPSCLFDFAPDFS